MCIRDRSCTASIYDHSGAEVYNRTRQGEGFSPFPNPDVVEVDTTAGPARIRFQETPSQICWTAYVLYYTPAGLYCGNSTCGAALKSDGWKVLSEWGTVNRFGEGLIGSHADFVAKGWFVPSDGSVACLLYTSPSPRDRTRSRMPSSA